MATKNDSPDDRDDELDSKPEQEEDDENREDDEPEEGDDDSADDGDDDDDDDDDDDSADDEDDEDDEDDREEAAVAKPPLPIKPPPAPRAVAADSLEDSLWWLPHAVLGTLVLVGVLGFFGFFNSFLRPLFHPNDASAASSASAQPSSAPAAVAPTATPRPLPTTRQPPPGVDPGAPVFGAKHLIVQWEGSKRSTQKRSKDEAKKRADEALAKAKGAPADFDKLVGEYSDEPGAAKTGGKLGRFHKNSGFDPRFFGAVEALKVGEMSAVVESDFGYHVIVRTE